MNRGPRVVACSVVRQLLYSFESRAREMPTVLERHRESCLSCQAHTVRQRQVLRGLHHLGEVVELLPSDAPVEFDPAPAAAGGEAEGNDLVGRRRPSRAAITSAASLAAIGAAVIAGRRIRSIA